MTRVNPRSLLLVTLLMTIVALAAGCMKPAADPYSHHFGEAYWANRHASIENPNAGTGDPVTGLDGATTLGVMENYRESQKDQPPVYEEDGLVDSGGSQ
jgi:hypothetical protein